MIAVDVSVVIKLFFPEIHSAEAQALFADAVQRSERIVAPPLLPVEVTNVIRKRMRSDGLSLAQAMVVLDDFLDQPISLINPPRLHHEALVLATAHSLGVHGAHYVALAQEFGCDLWVDDGRLLKAVRDRLPFVRWIGSFP